MNNEELEQFFGQQIWRIDKILGPKTRHIAFDLSTSKMLENEMNVHTACCATKRGQLEHTRLHPGDLHVIILSRSIPDCPFPATVFFNQEIVNISSSATPALQLVHLAADWRWYSSLVPKTALCLLASLNESLLCWLQFISLFLNDLDRVLDRLTQSDSIAGTFTEMLWDELVLVSGMVGWIWGCPVYQKQEIIFVCLHTTHDLIFLPHHVLTISISWFFLSCKTFLGLASTLYYFFNLHLLNIMFPYRPKPASVARLQLQHSQANRDYGAQCQEERPWNIYML